MEDHPRRRQEDRRRAVEAVTPPPGTASPAAAAPTSPPSTRSASRRSGRKEELVAEAETLADSTEWAATANRLKELMAEWKAAPRAAKEVEQKLWERFRAAQDAFFTRRSEVFSARDAEQQGNLERKQALLAEAEALDVDADPQGRAGQAARDPGASGTTPAGCPGRRPPGWTAGCARSTTRSATAMDVGLAAHHAGGQPAARPDARAGGRGRGAAGPGPGRRRRQAHPGGRGGAGVQAAVPRSSPSRPASADRPRQAGRSPSRTLAASVAVLGADRGRREQSGRARQPRRGGPAHRWWAARAAPRAYAVPGRPRTRRRPGCAGAPAARRRR